SRVAVPEAGEDAVTREAHTRGLTVPVRGGAGLLVEVIRELDTRDIAIDDIGLRRPTLDDVFISLTGHVAEGDAVEGDGDDAGGNDAGGDAGAGEGGANGKEQTA
ncbi:daunorubicin/doxorubicin resistance ABC transporter ATP-binding protein DrrA, partial [Streptomyces sp. SID11233]|nr:daunorubicin/doxorubicin resistance ABC transporter ATP-binding protein DrrA [Streptomyces sp. SID11233]